jgi:hypothetical protein
MTGMVICQDDERNTTGCGNGHLQDGDGEAIRSDCQARMATGHPNGMGRGNSKGKDRVKDCREHGSSGTGRDDLRGRQTPSPFLYMYSSESAHPRRALTPCPGAVAPSGTRSLACTSWATPGHQDRNQHPLPRAEKQNSLASRRDATSSLLSSLLYPPSSPVC